MEQASQGAPQDPTGDQIALDTLQRRSQDVSSLDRVRSSQAEAAPVAGYRTAVEESGFSLTQDITAASSPQSPPTSKTSAPGNSTQQVAGSSHQDEDLITVEAAPSGLPVAPKPPTGFWGTTKKKGKKSAAGPPPLPDRFSNYTEYVSSLLKVFPELGSIERLNSRGSTLMSFIDCSRHGKINVQNFVAKRLESEIDSPAFEVALKEPALTDTDIRIVLVEDINQAAIGRLGSTFDIDPEFFAEHLLQSDYNGTGSGRLKTRVVPVKRSERQGIEREETTVFGSRYYADARGGQVSFGGPADELNGSVLKSIRNKTYRSFWWFRPVELLPVLKKYEDPSSSRFSRSCICRSRHCEFPVDESMSTDYDQRQTRPLALWRERITVCEMEYGTHRLCTPGDTRPDWQKADSSRHNHVRSCSEIKR